MVKIGGVSIDVSHPKAFSEGMLKECMNMKYEYVCDDGGFRGEEEIDWLVKKFDLAGKVKKTKDMVDKVDIGFIQSCNWEKHIDQAMPFIEKGKPVFIDKPMVGSVKDANRVRELVKNGAKIYGSSCVRYVQEIADFLAKPVEERGEIVAIFGTSGVDEFNYSIHIVEGFSALTGCKAVSGKYIGKAVGPDGSNCEMYSLLYENGIRATYYSYLGGWRPFHLNIMTTKGTHSIIINTSYMPMLREVYKQVKFGESKLGDIEDILNSCEVMICCKISRDEKDGAEVKISDLKEDDKYDGYAFEAEYAKNAKVIFKD